jgi:hypothetical protein
VARRLEKEITMRTLLCVIAPLAVAVLAGCSSTSANSTNPKSIAPTPDPAYASDPLMAGYTIAANPTDLPVYPHLYASNAVPETKTTALAYFAATKDSYAQVLAWYRAQYPGIVPAPSPQDKQMIVFTVNGSEQVSIRPEPDNTAIVLTEVTAAFGGGH